MQKRYTSLEEVSFQILKIASWDVAACSDHSSECALSVRTLSGLRVDSECAQS